VCCESLAPATRCLALRLVEHELSKIRGAHLLTTHGSGYVGGLGRIHGGRIRGLGRIHGGRVGGLGCIHGGRVGGLGRIRGRRIGRLGRIRGRRVGRLCIIFPSPSPSPSPIPSAILVLVLSKKMLNSGTLDRTPFATALPIALKNPPAVILVIFHIFIGVRNNPLELYQTHPFLPPPTPLFWPLEQQALFRAF